MGLRLAEPGQLHERARDKAYAIDEIPYHMGVDRNRPYAPSSMSHLAYCPSYERLNEEERRIYSQVNGLAVAEQFIFLEEHLLIPALEGVMARNGRKLDPTLRMCYLDFIAEEYKHSEMFWRLLETAEPELYTRREPVVYRSSNFRRRLLTLLTDFPTTLFLWVWLGVVFEERTIDLYKKYCAEPDVDPLFAEVHRFHMLDEARHVRIDEHLLDTVYDPSPSWLKSLNVTLLNQVLGLFTHPKTSPRTAIDRVMARSPRLQAHKAEFYRDIDALGDNEAFQQANFSRDVLPQTFFLLDQYPEMAGLTTGLPLYRRG